MQDALNALIYRRRLYYLRRRLLSPRSLTAWEKEQIASELEKIATQNRPVLPSPCRLISRNTNTEE